MAYIERHGKGWRVRWYSPSGKKEATPTLSTRAAAESWLETHERDLAAYGPAHVDSSLTVEEWGPHWLRDHVIPHLGERTSRDYAILWDRYVTGRYKRDRRRQMIEPKEWIAPPDRRVLAQTKLRDLRVSSVRRWHNALVSEGVGEATRYRLLAMLSGAISHAISEEVVRYANPVRGLKRQERPQNRRARSIRPLTPEAIERVLAELPDAQSVILYELVAYAGLRPSEALALKVEDVRLDEARLYVEHALSPRGARTQTKNRRSRQVEIVPPLAEDLAAWIRHAGLRPGDSLVPARKSAGHWTTPIYNKWRREIYRPAAERVAEAMADEGLNEAPPTTIVYEGRHAFASLALWSGMDAAKLAQQLGDSVQTVLDSYVHVLDQVRGAGENRSPEALICVARKRHPRPTLDPAVVVPLHGRQPKTA
jgi:integrase